MLVQTESGDYINLTRGHIVTVPEDDMFQVTIIPMRGHTEHVVESFYDRDEAQVLMDRIADDFMAGRKMFRQS